MEEPYYQYSALTTGTQPVINKLQFVYRANQSTDYVITLVHEVALRLDGNSKCIKYLFMDFCLQNYAT